MKRSLDQLTEIAQKAVRIGSDLVKNSRPRTVTEKSDRDTYTDVDVRIERKIRAYLAATTPEIGFIGEEGGCSPRPFSSRMTWGLDPIDGTANYTHGIPLCAVQLALLQDGLAEVAAISLPFTDLHYWAATGHGAYLNGQKISVSKTDKLTTAIVAIGDYATGAEAHEKNKQRVKITATLAESVERVRMFGSAAHDLAWVAEGRVDAAIIMSNNILDVAPGILLAREAGASTVDATGNQYGIESNSVLVATPAIKELLLTALKRPVL